MLLFLLFFCSVLWIILFRFKRRRMYKLASAIPGPPEELPFIGSAHLFVGSTEDIMGALQRLSYEAMNHEGILRFWLGHILYFITLNPVDVDAVLKMCLEKDDLHRFMRKVLGNGGIFALVAIWRKRRKIMIPAFSPKNVENFVDIFSEQSQNLVDRLNKRVGCGNFSVWPYLTSSALDVVSETVMGSKINAQGDPKAPFLVSLQILFNLICKRVFNLWLQPDWLYKLFPECSHHNANIKVLHNYTDEVIRKKRQELKKEKMLQTEFDNNFDLSRYKKRSFLELLINLSGGAKGYSNVELREEVLTLTIAGTDTTALSAILLNYLRSIQRFKRKCLKTLPAHTVLNYIRSSGEIPPSFSFVAFPSESSMFPKEVFGDSDRLLVKEDLLKLKYLERVVKESLRLFPPVPFIIRKVLEDISLPSGRVLPAGSGVAISIWGIQRDPKYWGPDSECFDPDRFLPERFNLQHPCSFVAFGNGPRNCIGYQYALMSIKTMISTILRCYKIVGDEGLGPIPHIKCKLDLMMKDVDEFKIGLEKRSTTWK